MRLLTKYVIKLEWSDILNRWTYRGYKAGIIPFLDDLICSEPTLEECELEIKRQVEEKRKQERQAGLIKTLYL